MEVKGKVKTIFPPEKLSFQDGRTYTQQLILLDCGEYSRGGDFYENDLPFYFGEKHLGKLTAVTIGAEVSVSFGIKGRAYTYTDKKDQVKERTGYSVRLNAYDIQMVGSVQPARQDSNLHNKHRCKPPRLKCLNDQPRQCINIHRCKPHKCSKRTPMICPSEVVSVEASRI